MTYYSNELYHFGVKGMRWGVRRSRRNTNNGFARIRRNTRNFYRKHKTGIKRAAKIAGVAAGTAALAYGIRRLHRTGKVPYLTYNKPVGLIEHKPNYPLVAVGSKVRSKKKLGQRFVEKAKRTKSGFLSKFKNKTAKKTSPKTSFKSGDFSQVYGELDDLTQNYLKKNRKKINRYFKR